MRRVEWEQFNTIAGMRQSRVTFDDLDNGYVNDSPTAESPGTNYPTQPTLTVTGIYVGVVLEWGGQANLTNFSHYEVRVSATAGAPWSSLAYDGTGLGTEGSVTVVTVPFLVHAPLPLDGDADDPQESSWTYSVRRVTKTGVASPWSTFETANAKAVEDGTLGANSVYANNIRAGQITASKILAGAVGSTALAADALAFPSDDLVAYYSFDDGSAIDTSGEGNHGTITGATEVAGKSRKALSFDGVDDEVDVPAITINGPYSISMWAIIEDMADDGNSRGIVAGTAFDDGFTTYQSGTTKLLRYGSGYVVNYDITSLLGSMHHYIVVVTDTGATLYVDGAEVATATGTRVDWSLVTLGSRNGSYFTECTLDEVRIYDRALSAAEVASLYRFPGGVEPGAVDGLWLSDASIISDKIAAENFLFTKAVGSLNKKTPTSGDVRSYLGKDPAGDQADSDPVGISIEEYNGENYEEKFKAAMRSGGGVADAFVSGFFEAGESVLSSPGLIWVERSSPFTDALGAVGFGNDVFIAGGNDEIGRSTDGGKTWTLVTSPFIAGERISSIGFGNDVFIAFSSDNGYSRSTDDGATWSAVSGNPLVGTRRVRDIAYGNGVWVIVGDDGRIKRSTDDGATWGALIANSFGSSWIYRVDYYGTDTFVACGQSGDLAVSTDAGITWSALKTVPAGITTLQGLASGNGLMVAGDANGDIILSSDQGDTWTQVATDIFGGTFGVSGMVFANNIMLAFGANGGIARSTDSGRTWGASVYGDAEIQQPWGTDAVLKGAAAKEQSRFVIVGYLSSTPTTHILATSDWLEAGAGIVEQGSNSNGNYIRFSSGVQVCWVEYSESFEITTSSGYGGYFGDSSAITFSKAFTTTPSTVISTSNAVGAGPALGSATQVVARLRTINSVSSANRTISIAAIGYWS